VANITVGSAWAPAYSQVVTRNNVSYGGGVRARFIYDSLWYMLKGSLGLLGWFNPTVTDIPPGTRQNLPVQFLARQLDWTQPITLNTLAFAPDDVSSEEKELGSIMMEDVWVYYCDIFAESEAISLQLAGDMKDILWGKMSAVGRTFGPTVDILDLDQPGHYKIGYVEIANVTATRSPNVAQRWQQFLRVVRFEVCDWYILDNDDLSTGRAQWAFQP